MFKKIWNEIIMGTKCYLMLKQDREKTIKQLGEVALENGRLEKELAKNKTIARKIIRVVNSLLKREDSVNATKEIKALCNEIIKGEN